MHEKNISPFLSPKHFSARVDLAGDTFEIELATPDVSRCARSVWGDWGPMYTFTLGAATGGVRVTYRCDALAVDSTHTLDVSTLHLNSPVLWARRRVHPFYLELEDAARALRFAGYLGPKGEPAVLEVTPLRPELEIVAKLLPSYADRGIVQHDLGRHAHP